MPQDEMRGLVRKVAESLGGVEQLLDVRIADPRQLRSPRDPAERNALMQVAVAMEQLQRAVEAYQAVTGTWHGRPKIAIGWSMPPASGPEAQESLDRC